MFTIAFIRYFRSDGRYYGVKATDFVTVRGLEAGVLWEGEGVEKTHQKLPGEYLFPTIISMSCSSLGDEVEGFREGKTPVVKDPGG